MNYDEILGYIGEFGWYQKRLYFILCIPAITAAFHALSTVFVLALPNHRCAIPGLANDTYAVQGDAHQWVINQSIPLVKGESYPYEKCKLWVEDSNGNVSLGNRSETGCNRWVFDKDVFETTATEEMFLVCGDLIRRSHLNMLTQSGIMFGSLTLGTMSDVFGRKKILCMSLMGSLVTGILLIWVPEFISFCIGRFLLGVFGTGFFLNAFTLGIELVGPSKRMWTGMIIEVFWAVGEAILALMAYFIRNWRHLQIALSVPSVIYVTFWWIIPESPRWLMSNGRTEEAQKILERAAKVNKADLPKSAFDAKPVDEPQGAPNVKLYQLFSHPTLLIRSLIIFFNWCVVSMVYYGLSLNSGYLYGGVHLNFFLSVVVEMLGYALCFPLLDRIGRKALHTSCMIVGGVACCCTIFSELYLPEEYQPVTTALALLGKLGASAAFAIIYIYSSELFPTVVRSGGLGISSMSARVGSMASPYISDLGVLIGGDFGVALPLMIFGGLSVLAGLASLLLPETLGRKLPETIEEAIHFKNQKREDKSDMKMGRQKVVGISARKVDYDNPTLESDDVM